MNVDEKVHGNYKTSGEKSEGKKLANNMETILFGRLKRAKVHNSYLTGRCVGKTTETSSERHKTVIAPNTR